MPLWSHKRSLQGITWHRQGHLCRHGLDVRLLPPGPGLSPVDALSQGKADFAVLWLTTALQQPDRGLPSLNLAQLVQRASLMLVSEAITGSTRSPT